MEPRLADYLKAHDKTWPDPPVIVADEIAEAIDKQPPGETPTAESYGCVAPPFPLFFVEAATRIGRERILRGTVVSAVDDNQDNKSLPTLVDDPSQVYWQFIATSYVARERTGFAIQGYPGAMLIHLDKGGYILDDMTRVNLLEIEEWRSGFLPLHSLASHAVYMLEALSVMHRRCEVEVIEPSRQQRRKAERKRGTSLGNHYFLRVSPERRVYPHASSVKKSFHVREHEVRGHFRYYSPERPLFGKYSGMVWVDAFRKGKLDLGKIKKGYAVRGG